MTYNRLLTWLKKFQTELTNEAEKTYPDFNFYTLSSIQPRYGYAPEHAERIAIVDLEGYELTPQETLQDLILNFPEEIKAASANPLTGITKAPQWVKDKNGALNYATTPQYQIVDQHDFITHIRETYPHIYSVVGVRNQEASLNGQIYLTKKHAEEQLENYDYDPTITTTPHQIEENPGLLNLLDFVIHIDLEKSQIVFKQD